MRAARPDRPTGPLRELPGLHDVVLVADGASGQVLRAHQPRLCRDVAVTVFDAAAVDARCRLRFERELAVSARLPAHPSLLTVHEHGLTADGHPYLVTTWCAGGSLAALVEQGGGPVPVATALDVGIRLGGALEHLHRHGLVHLGVAPGRVLLDGRGRAVLAGLGGAAPAPAIPPAGGPSRVHAAPEVRAGRPATAASDVWSLASTVVFGLTGRPPCPPGPSGGPGVAAPPPLVRPDVPRALARLLRQALATPPDLRPTAVELTAGLRDVQVALGLAPTDVPVAAGTPSVATAAPAPQPWLRRRGRLATTGLALAGAALGTALGLGVLGGSQALAGDDPAPWPPVVSR